MEGIRSPLEGIATMFDDELKAKELIERSWQVARSTDLLESFNLSYKSSSNTIGFESYSTLKGIKWSYLSEKGGWLEPGLKGVS